MNAPRNTPWRSSAAFTMIELLITVAIVGLLSALVFGGYKQTVGLANRTKCVGNLKAIGIAIAQYANDNQGLLPGQSDNSIRTTYRIKNNDLGAFLAPYWDLPPADTVTRSAPALMCPAWKSVMHLAEGKCYWSPFRLKGFYNEANPTGYYCPFGKGQPDGQPLRMQVIQQIPGFNSSKQWMIQDFDQINGSTLNIPEQAATPVHGNVRNVLFFDYHIESVPASTVLN